MLPVESKADTNEAKPAPKKSEAKKTGLIAKIKSVKHLDIIIAVVVIIIILIIYFSTFISSGDTDKKTADVVEKDYCARVVDEMEEKLSKVSGVGSVSVLINWEYSEELVPAYTTNSSGSTSVVTTGGQIHILKTIYPTPKGIIIICDGANSISIKMNLISAVSSYFGISENTITVLAKATNN